MNDYDNFFLPASDLVLVKDFYGRKLGFQCKFDFSNRGMIAFQVGRNEPALIFKDTAKFPDARPAIWFVTDSVKNSYRELTENGIRFISEPFRIQTGYAAEFTDPFGNRLGITDYTV